MRIRKIAMTNVTSHDRSVVELPETGLVVITGENGAGKSTIVEAPPWAVWGKTLRGDPPWRGDAKEAPCTVQLQIDTPCALAIARTRRGGKTELEWTDTEQGVSETEFETPSKAQEALAAIVGPFDLWRRSHVFSSADAMHFSLASDSDRKRLIETFLGNDRFEPALKKCREDLKLAATDLSAKVRERDVLAARVGTMKEQSEASRRLLEELGDVPPKPPAAPSGESVAVLEKKIKDGEREVAAARSSLRGSDMDVAKAATDLRSAADRSSRLQRDACPTCEQAIPATLKRALKASVADAQRAQEAAQAVAHAQRAEVEALIEELSAEVSALRVKRSARASEVEAASTALATHARATSQRALIEAALERNRTHIGDLTRKTVALDEEIDELTVAVDELAECESVLGLKGVRAHILGRALGGIEAVANVWLSRLHKELSLSLKPYSEKGVQDAISLTLHGKGRGSYRSTSAGERRRVDIALLLGLAEVSSAALGATTGTLFFDEVLDALDEAGIEAMVAALRDLAQTRCVVVITHSTTLLERVPGAQRLHVAQGRIGTLG